MSQRNLITSQLLGMRIQITTSHSRTKITGIILNFCHCIKNITFKNRKRNSQKLCIILNNLPVIRIIARIHYQKHQFKMNLPMALQLLKQLRHQHRVLTTWNTDSNLIPLLNQLILIQSLGKRSPDCLSERLDNTVLNLFRLQFLLLLSIILHKTAQRKSQIRTISTFNIHSLIPCITQLLHTVPASVPRMAENIHHLLPVHRLHSFLKLIQRNIHCPRKRSPAVLIRRPHIHDRNLRRINLLQLFHTNCIHI